MRKIIALYLLIVFHYAACSQVIISPEIGVSYHPFTLYGGTVDNESNGVDLLFGLNGQLALSSKYFLNLRVSYANREDFIWTDFCFCPTLEYTSYEHSDLNIDLNALYQLPKRVNFGLGPSIVRKLNTRLTTKYTDGETIDHFTGFYFGLNSTIGFEYERFFVRFFYVRRFNSDYTIYYPTEGKNRFDMSISYALFGDMEK